MQLLRILPFLDSKQRSKRQNKKHEQNRPRMEYVFVPLCIFHLHVVPVHIVRSVCVADANRFAADSQEISISVELPYKIVSVVLVLEGDEGLAGKVSQFETSHLSLIIDVVLTQFDVFLVEVFDLVGNVLQQESLAVLDRSSLGGSVLLKQLFSHGLDVLKLGEVVADANGSNGPLSQLLYIELTLVNNILNALQIQIAKFFTFIPLFLKLFQPDLYFILQNLLQLLLILIADFLVVGILPPDKRSHILNQNRVVAVVEKREGNVSVLLFYDYLPEYYEKYYRQDYIP